MLFVLTALAILPDDLASQQIAKQQAAVARRVAGLEQIAQQCQGKVSQIEAWTRQARVDDPSQADAYRLLVLYHQQLFQCRKELEELRSPPFAAAIWQVRPAVKP